MGKLLEIKDLSVEFRTDKGIAHAVNDVSLSLEPGENLGIVGESGSGKSTLAHAVMRLLSPSAVITDGQILFDGTDLTALPEDELRALCGRELSMIFQDPMQCLDPSFSVGYQLTECLLAHRICGKAEAKERSAAMLERVGIHEAKEVMRRYPFQLSGGMRQRVMIAMALLTGPKLLIADEPTTALDVTIQDQILQLLKDYAKQEDLSVLFITHSFGVVADICDKVAVLYGGRVAEAGTVRQLFYRPCHPYTAGLLNAVPTMEHDKNVPLQPIEGTPVNVFRLSEGCPFCDRCGKAAEICRKECPELKEVEEGHFAACHFAE
ncbi:MAG: ABC transporter ATP-binding protein [Lachnospiraceae bacterium]|nr:ABC transporter ATP-binding protein [Lachnospiraceae bacterium]